MKLFAIVCLTAVVVLASGQSIDVCLNQDSISCIQRTIYRKAREFFDNDSLEIVSGVSLVKAKEGRSSRSSKEVLYDQEIETADNVAERQSVLENFVGNEVGDFFSGRSLQINFSPAIEKIGQSARAISDSVPQEIRQAVDEVVEDINLSEVDMSILDQGSERIEAPLDLLSILLLVIERGSKKKMLLKQILPLLAVAKLKYGLIAVLGYFAIALIAKKAILVSLLAIAISGFLKVKSYLEAKGSGITGYNNGWNAGASSGFGGSGASAGAWQSSSPGWESGAGQSFSGYHR